MQNSAPADHPVIDVIRHRWSPRAYSDRPVEKHTLQSLFEAARWAMSSYNEQPWIYLIASRDEPKEYELILNCLVPFNQGWAKSAPVLGISLARCDFSKNGEPNRHAYHDVGAASGFLSLQAASLGLFVHQMAGIEPDRIRSEFKVPAGIEPVAGFAIGYPGDPETLDESLRERELAPRSRQPIETFVFGGVWGATSALIRES